jgi:hypothetical protein
MNLQKILLRRAPVVFALWVGLFLIPTGRAQMAPQITESRYLFIFDTSANMKKRLPAVQMEVNQLLSTSMGGQLRPGDSIGLWTFDNNLLAGQFPLQRWKPEDAVTIASGINKFIGKQRYANKTRFNALQPQLNQVIRDSERLTVLIFCDGEDEIKWTPYNAGINQVFQQRLAEQKKTQQPFVLVFRTQVGQYAGCSMNFPPGMVSVPEFPPPPAPPASPPAAPAPPPAPVVKPPIGPPLIIIGTKVETNQPHAANPAPAVPANPIAPKNPVVPQPPPKPAPAMQTNAAPAPPANPAPATRTNPVPIPASKPAPSTNAVATPLQNTGADHGGVLAIGAVLLVAAGGLVALAVFRGRRTSRGSLISRSMRKD